MSMLFRQVLHNSKQCYIDLQIPYISFRKLSILPSYYDGDQDPAPKFFSPSVQILLKRLTRPDFPKVFRKRTDSGMSVLKTPRYKFLTSEELESELAKAKRKANYLLQMPPAVKIHKHIENVLSKDAALMGYDTSKYLFTDISFGVTKEERIIVERNVDGSLCNCDNATRKRLNQAYFPMVGRKIREPVMFSDEERLHSLLERQAYEFVLDRACIQYDPDEPSYQRVTSVTYQHVNLKHNYDLLRSTRHFGSLVFYLTWHQTIDSLLLELIQNLAIREAVCLIDLRHTIHKDVTNGDIVKGITQEILATPIQLTKPDRLSEEDIKLDNKCLQCVETYISNNSSMKSQQELALQGFRESYQQTVDLSRGLRKAHGAV